MAYNDYRVCSNCNRAVTGYGFVAALKGLDPKWCSVCNKATLVKKPCPKEVEDDLRRHGDVGVADGGRKGPRAGESCTKCLLEGFDSKLVARPGVRPIPGLVKPLGALVCTRCLDELTDPDDPVLLEAARKAEET